MSLSCTDIVPKSQNELLPEGWKELVHNTGMVLYCHLPTRVVTWSRPYFLADRFAKVPVTFCTIIFMLLFKVQLFYSSHVLLNAYRQFICAIFYTMKVLFVVTRCAR